MRVWLALIGLLWAVSGDAKTLYVNNSGTPACSDGTSYAANGSGAPWCNLTVATGSASVVAGDVVIVVAGTYSAAGSGNRFTPAFNPQNSGTAGNYITFQCDTYSAGTSGCELRLSSSTGPVFGSTTRSYVRWIGFKVNEQFATPAADTGPVLCHNTNHVVLTDNVITGYQYGHNLGDNHPGIRLEDCTASEFRRNTISNFYTCPDFAACTSTTPVNPVNGACIQSYGSTDNVIENNDLTSCGSGVFIKGGPSGGWVGSVNGNTVRYNKIGSMSVAGLAINTMPANTTTRMLFYQNIVTASAAGVQVRWFGDAQDPQNTWFINNTFSGNTACLEMIGTPYASVAHALRFWNNICATQTNVLSSVNTGTFHADGAEVDWEHNVYFSTSSTVFVMNGGGTTASLATWQGVTYNQDAASPAAISSDPLFAASGSGDYRLCTGSAAPAAGCAGASPALAQAVDALDLDGDTSTTDNVPAGAYVTGAETIGAAGGGGGGSGTYFPRFRRFRPGE